ncbi:unnamed protein product [Blepharisma stoltei]|uniref:Uncharacterized protein n=1 Tax=Blepharisma stoltei TaxID=1481888 RepID=A0AAU9KIB5_9CILI|nr:unnamed protein product [Blepharisma stoltei]
MSKRNKQKSKATKNVLSSSRPNTPSLISRENPNDFSLLRVSEVPIETFKFFNQGSAESLRGEIINSITQIYGEYLNDYIAKKKKRLSSKNPLEQRQSYNLVIDQAFKLKLREALKHLVNHSAGIRELHNCLYESVHSFVDSLNGQLIELIGKSKMLQAISLVEAYHTLQNASNEIGKIVSCLFEDRELTFENMNKLLFYERIVKGSAPLIEHIKNQDSRHFVVPLIQKMEKESRCAASTFTLATPATISTRDFMNASGTMCNIPSDDSFSSFEGENQADPLHTMSLDELVKYINGEEITDNKKKTRKSKKSKASTAATSRSPKNESHENPSFDQEIENFKQRLEMCKILPKRIKPLVSQDYVDSLRSKIYALKEKHDAR